MKKWLWICFCTVITAAICGAAGCVPERDYREDVRLPLEEQDAEIVIREWSFLLGSGAEVYYRDENGEVLLGTLLGGDNGFCPFENGLYRWNAEENRLTIEWCRFPSRTDEPWDQKSFELPDGGEKRTD